MKYLALLILLVTPAFAVYPPPRICTTFTSPNDQALAAELLATTTTQYVAGYADSPYAQNTTIVTVTKKNPNYIPPSVSTTTIAVNEIIKKLVVISTWTYVYGWADGMDNARKVDLSILSEGVKHCDSFAYFDSIVTIMWSKQECIDTLMAMSSDILLIQKSTPTFVVAPR